MENPEFPVVRVATAGEALIDLVQDSDGRLVPCAGGSVHNFTLALARQGVGTGYLNPLSRDRFGRALAAGLQLAGVRLARPAPVPEPTSLAVVGVDEAGQPDYAFYREGVADRAITAGGLNEACQAWPGLQAICTGCLALAPEDARHYLPWLAEGRRRGLLVVVDANLRPSLMRDAAAWRASIRSALALADVIKVSDEDLAALLPQQPDPLLAAQSLFGLSPARCIAWTRGAAGASLLARDGRGWSAREQAPVQVIDTVGAGDSFLAGLVAGLLAGGGRGSGLAWEEAVASAALARAVAAASLVVQRRGCVPPDRGELEAHLARGTIRVAAGLGGR